MPKGIVFTEEDYNYIKPRAQRLKNRGSSNNEIGKNFNVGAETIRLMLISEDFADYKRLKQQYAEHSAGKKKRAEPREAQQTVMEVVAVGEDQQSRGTEIGDELAQKVLSRLDRIIEQNDELLKIERPIYNALWYDKYKHKGFPGEQRSGEDEELRAVFG